MYQIYPRVEEVEITDSFWCAYLREVRETMLPYVFEKMEESGYMQNYISVAKKDGNKHIGLPFWDGFLMEAIRGACDFLAIKKDEKLEKYLDDLIELFASAMGEDGYLCTQTTQDYPQYRFGDNGGDIVEQHDLYNHGGMIEAAISHYRATKKTTLLALAVRSANLICKEIGYAPKKNIVPGHSLAEEAFVKLYKLFQEEQDLQEFKKEHDIHENDYLDIVEFWFDARGNHEGRFTAKRWSYEYSQDHAPFAEQRKAVGHSVRAMLCYLGATAVLKERDRKDYLTALNAIWDNVVYKKLHVSGGIGANHDIEGFAEDYYLPNAAYLETCAAIGLAFWNTEMNLIETDSKYFDVFEQSLYNNIMSGIGADFKHFFYQNPIYSDGSIERWDWHVCPCCPPMLLKILSALGSFIYSYSKAEKTLNVNMLIDSRCKNEVFSVEKKGDRIFFDSLGEDFTLKIRIPEYVENFKISIDEKAIDFSLEKGYAVLKGVFSAEKPVELSFETPIRRLFANPKVKEDVGKVAVACGPWIFCAEGIDNDGKIDFTLSETPAFEKRGDFIVGKTVNGECKLIPYGKWCNRGKDKDERKMTVWISQENMKSDDILAEYIKEKLYGDYEKV